MLMPKPDPVKLARIVELKEQLKEAEEAFQADMLSRVDLKLEEVVQDRFTGLHYTVKRFGVSVHNGEPNIHVDAYRVWKTGRKAGRVANSSSFVSFSALEKLPPV